MSKRDALGLVPEVRQTDFNYNTSKAALYWYFSNILIRGLTLQFYISAIDLAQAVQTYWLCVLSN